MPQRYANLDPRHLPHGIGDVLRWSFLDPWTGRRRSEPPGLPAPRVPADRTALNAKDGPARLTWIGHASFLATVAGVSFLIDPVFSTRIARVVRRHGAPGLSMRELPPLAAVLVTHNHYDHLDDPSIRALPRSLAVLAPAGLGRWFRRRGFGNVTEMRWWDRASIGPLTVTFVPARHWSRRTPRDTNRSAWGGYVIQGEGVTVYHAGDTGWFEGFRAIGERYPSIDVAMLPIGAYAPAWFMEPHHMNPEQAIDAAAAVGARTMVPMHWGAFQLTDEPLRAPMTWLARAWERRQPARRLRVLAVGETIAID